MPKNIYGGGARTNLYGLKFEQETSINDALTAYGYFVNDGYVYLDRNRKSPIALSAPKFDLYRKILEPRHVIWQDYLSKRMIPDDALLNNSQKTIYIIEKKFQHGPGSVDEKLQTCHFKKRQYNKLFEPIGIEVEYIYVCNDWFLKNEYRDVVQYINDVGCHIYFNSIPIHDLGLCSPFV